MKPSCLLTSLMGSRSAVFGLYGAEYRCFQITQDDCWGMKGMVLWFGAQFGRSQNINVLELQFIKRPNVKQSTIAKDANVLQLACSQRFDLTFVIPST